ncbi:MAG: hypothetical protein GWN30_27000, partial [Gammaproteobacteria bacterium]|nr:hypothetical protein [Gammaproteobacteria bacterium]
MLFTWADHWLIPLFSSDEESEQLLGLLGVTQTEAPPDEEQVEALVRLARRAQTALEDRYLQQQVFTSLEELTSQVDFIQRLRAAS